MNTDPLFSILFALKYLSIIFSLIVCCNNTSAQKGFGFSYSHKTIEEEDGSEENVYTINYIYRHSPAEKAGVMKGDKIDKFHDAIVYFQNTLAFAKSIKNSPDTIQLVVTRQGKKMEFKLTKADRSTYLNICLEGNCINGKGTFVTEEGNTYTGLFKNGKREGIGKLTSPLGSLYEGDWKNNMRDGKGNYIGNTNPGIINVSAFTYVGDWKKDSMTGKGVITYFGGSYYVGEVYQNYRQGQGKLVLLDSSSYDGFWQLDKQHGKGVQVKANGDKLTGNFVNGRLEGEVLVFTRASNISAVVLYKNGFPQKQ
jgi:hypothetical protein